MRFEDISAPPKLFIGGQFVDSSDAATFDVVNPSDSTVLATVASASAQDCEEALSAACAAAADWANTPTRERSEILRRAFELIMERKEEFAYLMSYELGRALPDSRGEVVYGAEFFRWFAEEAVRVRGDYRYNPAGNARMIVTHRPVGPVVAITPWNFPLAMGTRKLGPALAAGCTAVVKPASKTPLTMLLLAQVLKEAGLPDGVVNVVPTKDSKHVSALLQDPRVRKLTFTGSTEVGQQLAADAAKNSLRVSLELGGNAPFIVLEDADIDLAVDAAMAAKMRGAGQVCIAANRFLVHVSLAEEFAERLSKRMGALVVGAATQDGVEVGPLSGEDQVSVVTELVDDAVTKGATLCTGGNRPEHPGCFYLPTVLKDVPADAAITKAEIFGPVIALRTFTTEEYAVQEANATPFGLAAYVIGPLDRALSVAERIEAGMVAINRGVLSDPSAPFGGVKQSGLGREGGFEGIHEFLETHFIAMPAE